MATTKKTKTKRLFRLISIDITGNDSQASTRMLQYAVELARASSNQADGDTTVELSDAATHTKGTVTVKWNQQ